MLDELIVKSAERTLAESGRGRDGPGHRGRPVDGGQVAEADPVPVPGADLADHLQRQPGLSHASWPVQGEQSHLAQQSGYGRAVPLASDETGHWQRQRPVHWLSARFGRRERVAQDVLFHVLQGR